MLYEIEMFNGKNGFGLWKLKFVALSGNFGSDELLQDEESANLIF